MSAVQWLLAGSAALLAAVAAAFRHFYMPYPHQEPDEAVLEPPEDPGPAPLPPSPRPNMPEKVYEAAAARIGRHLTLDPSVPAEEGCCEALSAVLQAAGYQMPPKGIAGVNAMVAWMLGRGFVEIADGQTPFPGCVIAAHRPAYGDPEFAHIGVVMRHGICSNTSATGLWQENYPGVEAWRAAFSTGGSLTRIFAPA